jgi:hypothetical protein
MTKFEDTIHELRAVICDESRSRVERQTAATHLVALKDTATDPIADDDPDVLELLKPWPQDSEFDISLAQTWAEVTGGRSLHGWSLPDAREQVAKDRLSSARYAAVRDETLPLMERLETARVILELSPDHSLRRNNYTPEKMLEKIMAATP